MTPDQAVARAHSACGNGAKYGLGAGGMNPERAVPWNDHMQCDCSGFVMWALGLSRRQGGIWYDTTRVKLDAIDGGALFRAVEWKAAQPGDLLVYGDHRDHDGVERQGHVAMVSLVKEEGPVLMVHCSLGNWTRHSDAIREDGVGLFLNHPDAVVARCLIFEATQPA